MTTTAAARSGGRAAGRLPLGGAIAVTAAAFAIALTAGCGQPTGAAPQPSGVGSAAENTRAAATTPAVPPTMVQPSDAGTQPAPSCQHPPDGGTVRYGYGPFDMALCLRAGQLATVELLPPAAGTWQQPRAEGDAVTVLPRNPDNAEHRSRRAPAPADRPPLRDGDDHRDGRHGSGCGGAPVEAGDHGELTAPAGRGGRPPPITWRWSAGRAGDGRPAEGRPRRPAWTSGRSGSGSARRTSTA